MAAKLTTLLNQVNRADWTAAQMNAVDRPYGAITVNTFGGQSIVLAGIDAGILCFTAADYASVFGVAVAVQRNLTPNPNISIFNQEQAEETVFYDVMTNTIQQFQRNYGFNSPLILDPGFNYAIYIGIALSAPVAGTFRLWLNARGTTFNNANQP